MFKQHNAVASRNRAKAVRNQNTSHPSRCPEYILDNCALGQRIEIAGCFIQDKNTGIAKHNSRESDALTLSAGQVSTALFYHEVETHPHTLNKLGYFAHITDAPKVLIGRLHIAKTNVVPDCSTEQEWLLR